MRKFLAPALLAVISLSVSALAAADGHSNPLPPRFADGHSNPLPPGFHDGHSNPLPPR